METFNIYAIKLATEYYIKRVQKKWNVRMRVK